MLIQPQSSWQASTHYLNALSDPWYELLVSMQDAFTTATVGFWAARGVRNLHLPITTSAVSSPMGIGSDSLPVSVMMFGVQTYLADSMQFMLEYGCRVAAGGCYYLMPSFRGEPADQTHLCQFFHSEAELPGDLDDVMATAEGYVRAVSTSMLATHEKEIADAARGTAHLENALASHEWPRITLEEATALLKNQPGALSEPIQGIQALTRMGERLLIDRFGGPVWVTKWNQMLVPFYQATDQASGNALNADLLVGPGEILGAGQRHLSAEAVTAALDLHGVVRDAYEWYVEMKHHSPLMTSGFGLGVERYLMWLLQQQDIRDFELVPRRNAEDLRP